MTKRKSQSGNVSRRAPAGTRVDSDTNREGPAAGASGLVSTADHFASKRDAFRLALNDLARACHEEAARINERGESWMDRVPDPGLRERPELRAALERLSAAAGELRDASGRAPGEPGSAAAIYACDLVNRWDGQPHYYANPYHGKRPDRELLDLCDRVNAVLRRAEEATSDELRRAGGTSQHGTWLTVSDAAYVTGLSVSYISKLCKRSKLPYHGDGRNRRIPADALRAFSLRRTHEASPSTSQEVQFNRRLLERTRDISGKRITLDDPARELTQGDNES